MTSRSAGRKIVRSAGELLVTAGVIVALFAAYEFYGKASAIDARQHVLSAQLTQAWSRPLPAREATPQRPGVRPGAGLARLYIPRLGKHWVVVEGVSPRAIADAPGHYPGTALPGQVGNFSVAGHREPAMFWDLQRIRVGDRIVVESRTAWYVYDVTLNEIVSPSAIEVVAPTPDEPGVAPSAAMLTLTTCNPKWHNYQRMVVHARLATTAPRWAGPPVPVGG